MRVILTHAEIVLLSEAIECLRDNEFGLSDGNLVELNKLDKKMSEWLWKIEKALAIEEQSRPV